MILGKECENVRFNDDQRACSWQNVFPVARQHLSEKLAPLLSTLLNQWTFPPLTPGISAAHYLSAVLRMLLTI